MKASWNKKDPDLTTFNFISSELQEEFTNIFNSLDEAIIM
jgi:hypothetical protein